MKGKWAAGIPPRNFTWVIRDRLAVSERPGGFSPNHRRVRRQEEIIWLRVQEFNRVISLLPSPHNLQAYEDGGLAWAHYALSSGIDPRPVMGVVAGFLVWSGRLTSGPQAVATVEHMIGRQMGPGGRELVAAVNVPPARTV
jgi:hypothetical protein